jgi:hypothetical protein
MSTAKIGPHKVVHDDHTVLHPPTTLRDKGLSKVRQTRKEFEETLARAEMALEALAPSFAEWMSSETRRLSDSLDVFENGPRDADALQSLFLVAHDFRGQAKQFGYPLAGQIATGLCELLQGDDALEIPLVILRSHVDAVCSIVRFGVRDEANEVALEMARALSRVLADYRTRQRGALPTG